MSHNHIFEQDPCRRSGRTTMLALNYVHIILDNPGTWIEIEDHGPTLHADRHLFDLVRRVLNSLGVPFESKHQYHQIMCVGPPRPYEYPEAEEIFEQDHKDYKYNSRKHLRF